MQRPFVQTDQFPGGQLCAPRTTAERVLSHNLSRVVGLCINRQDAEMSTSAISYKRQRFPPEIIAHAVWLYCRFNLSLRAVEEMLLERGIDISHETLRRWVVKFGPIIARGLRRQQPPSGGIWHPDEVVVKIKGRKFRLWRAVGENGIVLDEILQRRRDRKAAKRLLVRLMKKQGQTPKRFIADKLGSCGAAMREIAPGIEHRSHKGLNNRAGNSHLPFRKRQKAMQGYRAPGGLQRFASIHSAVRNCFSVPIRRVSMSGWRRVRRCRRHTVFRTRSRGCTDPSHCIRSKHLTLGMQRLVPLQNWLRKLLLPSPGYVTTPMNPMIMAAIQAPLPRSSSQFPACEGQAATLLIRVSNPLSAWM